MLFKHEPDCISWNGDIPEGLQRMLVDYVAIVNHLIALGLHHKIGLETHHYPLAEGDETKKRKPIPADRELRDLGKAWFVEHYKGKYQIHYLDSAASFAMQHVKSWRSNGGDISALPYVRKPIARLNNDLYTIQELSLNGCMKIRITLAPRKWIFMDIDIKHRHFVEWTKNHIGALVILPRGLRLVFTDDEAVTLDPRKDGAAAIDINLDRVVIARSDGQIRDVNISDITVIQQNHKRKRESVQRTMSHNPKKAERLVSRHSKRQHNRINDRLHKKIHGKDNKFLSFVGNRVLGIEDLSTTTKNILKDDHGRNFNERMSKWVHGEIEDILQHHHPTKEYYTRGTSQFCPFDGSTLKTKYRGKWKHSYCLSCDTVYDRDHLEAIHGLLRLIVKHKKGEPWVLVKEVFAPEVETEFKRSSIIITFTPTDVGMGTSSLETVSLFAPNVPSAIRLQSDTDGIHQIHCPVDAVVHGNRSDAYDKKSLSKTGYDAKTRRTCTQCK